MLQGSLAFKFVLIVDQGAATFLYTFDLLGIMFLLLSNYNNLLIYLWAFG
jgi:hypothetical protein